MAKIRTIRLLNSRFCTDSYLMWYMTVIFLCFGVSLQQAAPLTTLSQMVQYADTMPENPVADTLDIARPQFNTHYATYRLGYLDRLKVALGFKSDLNVESFFERLARIVHDRELDGYSGKIVEKMIIDSSTKWFILSPLCGSFHSLIRSLQYLHKQLLIDDNLQFTNQATYAVFNGDTKTYTPYAFEILYVQLLLMERNPGKIIILREADIEVSDSSLDMLYDELTIQFRQEKMYVQKQLALLYNTLPLALYLVHDDKKVVRISSTTYDQLLQSEAHWAYFFDDGFNGPVKIDQIDLSDIKRVIRARIELHQCKETEKQLEYLHFDKGEKSFTWKIFSSSAPLFKTTFNLHKDSLLVLDTNSYFSHWRLSSFLQNVEDKRGFQLVRLFNVATGKELYSSNIQEHIISLEKQIASALHTKQMLEEVCTQTSESIKKELNGKSEKILTIAMITDFSKASKRWSYSLKSGLLLPIDEINNVNGIDGTHIRILFLDDEYKPEFTRRNVEHFIKEAASDTLLGANGTEQLKAYLDLVKEKKVLVVFPNTGSHRDSTIPYLLHFGPSYKEEGYAVTKYVLDQNMHAKKIAFFYQNDDYGIDLLQGAKEALNMYKDKVLLEVPYDAQSAMLVDQVNLINEFKPDVIAFFSLPLITQKLIRKLGANLLKNKLFIGNNRLGDVPFREFLTEHGMIMVTPHVVPNPNTSDIEIVREFREKAIKNNIPIEVASLFGYIESSLFLWIAKKMGMPFSQERFVSSFESIEDEEFKGLKLHFDPRTRQLSHTIWLDVGTDHWIEQEIKS